MTADAEFEENHRRLYDALMSAYNAQGRFVALGQHKEAKLINVALFAILFNFDLSCLLRDLSAPRAAWHIKLHARHVVLTMHECVEDFLSLLGKDFRDLVRERCDDPTIMPQINLLHSRLREFQHEHPDFETIRNTVAAHREHDGMAQVKTLLDIDVPIVTAAAYHMLKWLSELHGLVTTIIRAPKNPPNISPGAA